MMPFAPLTPCGCGACGAFDPSEPFAPLGAALAHPWVHLGARCTFLTFFDGCSETASFN